MLSFALGCAIDGIEAIVVRIEADASAGTPSLTLIGLPGRSLTEARDRVRAALANSGFALPPGKLLLNLSPADVRKEGPGFDLPIALALLAGDGKLDGATLAGFVALGELALDGSLRPVAGVLPAALAAKRAGIGALIVPAANAPEATLVDGVAVYAIATLIDAVAVVLGHGAKFRAQPGAERDEAALGSDDFADVRGQVLAKRALEIAAAGGHNVLMIGPPGCGKTMLAQRVPSILPDMSDDEALQVTAIYSAAGMLGARARMVRRRPFRSPHHTISRIALIGGGSHPRPGEVTLAQSGVLYLDEIAEFPRSTLEVLRQPLESGVVTISRASGSAVFPARFSLIAAMNPCPCGNRGERGADCRCNDADVERYRKRLSGPLLDRIDLHVALAPVPYDELATAARGEASASIRERVLAARARQHARSDGLNAELGTAVLRDAVRLDAASADLLERTLRRERLSARAFDRILRVARTIADLADADRVGRDHLAEALLYRRP